MKSNLLGPAVSPEDLDRRERQYRALIENVYELIVAIDRNGILRFGNTSLERILGFPPDRKSVV